MPIHGLNCFTSLICPPAENSAEVHDQQTQLAAIEQLVALAKDPAGKKYIESNYTPADREAMAELIKHLGKTERLRDALAICEAVSYRAQDPAISLAHTNLLEELASTDYKKMFSLAWRASENGTQPAALVKAIKHYNAMTGITESGEFHKRLEKSPTPLLDFLFDTAETINILQEQIEILEKQLNSLQTKPAPALPAGYAFRQFSPSVKAEAAVPGKTPEPGLTNQGIPAA